MDSIYFDLVFVIYDALKFHKLIHFNCLAITDDGLCVLFIFAEFPAGVQESEDTNVKELTDCVSDGIRWPIEVSPTPAILFQKLNKESDVCINLYIYFMLCLVRNSEN